MPRLRFVLPLVAVILAPALVHAQGTPLGPEFRVNTYTTGLQFAPSVAFDAAGNFVAVWESPHDGGGYGVFGQRYASGGAPLGGEFRVNTYTTGTQGSPVAAFDGAGNFLVVWHSSQDGSGLAVMGQRYAGTGVPLGAEFRVNTYTTSAQRSPAAASDSTGNFVVVWESFNQDASGYGIFGQRYDNSGAPIGGEFQVNSNTVLHQRYPSVASDAAGNFVVAWEGYAPADVEGVFARRFASTGAPLGADFRVNTYATNAQRSASVASDAAGNFVVAWDSVTQDGSASGIFAQRYASTGAPAGGEFRVNSYTTFDQSFASVASDAAGNFVVAWQSNNQDGGGLGVFAQRYASTGAPSGAEFRANTQTASGQSGASAACDPAGNFVVAWQGNSQDGSGYGIFAQRYSMIVPVELQGFGVE